MRLLSTFQHCPFVKKIENEAKTLGGKPFFHDCCSIFFGGGGLERKTIEIIVLKKGVSCEGGVFV
jgi:hypothetical protein